MLGGRDQPVGNFVFRFNFIGGLVNRFCLALGGLHLVLKIPCARLDRYVVGRGLHGSFLCNLALAREFFELTLEIGRLPFDRFSIWTDFFSPRGGIHRFHVDLWKGPSRHTPQPVGSGVRLRLRFRCANFRRRLAGQAHIYIHPALIGKLLKPLHTFFRFIGDISIFEEGRGGHHFSRRLEFFIFRSLCLFGSQILEPFHNFIIFLNRHLRNLGLLLFGRRNLLNVCRRIFVGDRPNPLEPIWGSA